MTIETLNAIKAQAEALQESTLDLGGASFYRLTATDPVNGNVETKDIVSATLSSEQLV